MKDTDFILVLFNIFLFNQWLPLPAGVSLNSLITICSPFFNTIITGYHLNSSGLPGKAVPKLHYWPLQLHAKLNVNWGKGRQKKYRHLGRKKKQIAPSICKWDPGFKDICISDLSRHDYWRKTAFEPCVMFGRWFIARGSLRKRETQITSYRVFLLSSAAEEKKHN